MNKLLVVLGFSANDAIQCERLLDLIAIYNSKIPRGDLLLVAAPDTHSENRVKCKIAAEIAFENVELLEVGWPAVAHTTKYEAVNLLFASALTHAARCYQAPALWIEPDCVPLKPTWLEELACAYSHQPKRYLGSILVSADGKQRCLSRVAIYPRGAGGELKDFCTAKTPFEIAAGNIIVPRAGKSKLFQQLAFTSTTERSAIREDAALLHHDKAGVLLSALIEEANKPAPLGPSSSWKSRILLSDSGIRQDIFVPLPSDKQTTPILHIREPESSPHQPPVPILPKALEIPPTAIQDHVLPVFRQQLSDPIHATLTEPPNAYVEPEIPKLDGRTKAGKAAKKALTPANA